VSTSTFSYYADDELQPLPEEQGVAYVAGYEDGYEEDDFDGLNVNPYEATEAKPGSEDKVKMLAARYAAGLPLWNQSDCYDHGPDGQIDEDEEEDLLEGFSSHDEDE
jgi:hypothetical protein